jgi:hypothetical protein
MIGFITGASVVLARCQGFDMNLRMDNSPDHCDAEAIPSPDLAAWSTGPGITPEPYVVQQMGRGFRKTDQIFRQLLLKR